MGNALGGFLYTVPKQNSRTYFVEASRQRIILRVLRLEVSIYNVSITNQLKSVKVTVNGKEESFCDFCPNNVQEFGLSGGLVSKMPEGDLDISI